MGAGVVLGMPPIVAPGNLPAVTKACVCRRGIMLSPPKELPLTPSLHVLFADPTRDDCPGRAIYVTSLNMRKWMKDRLQRRKKKAPEQGSQPAPPPLQPAYFDAEETPSTPSHSESSHVESSHVEPRHDEAEIPAASETEFEAPPTREEPANTQHPPRKPATRGEGQRGRGRRRRGGRGRGGRGREQAVAQAFSPAVIKGNISDLPVQQAEEGPEEALDTAEPEAQAVPPTTPIPPAVPAAAPRPDS